MNNFKRFFLMALSAISLLSLSACGDENDEPNGGSNDSNAKVEVVSIYVGSKDKAGRYTVKINVKASNLTSDETVRTIGAKWGTVKSNQSHRDSRSSTTRATFTTAWHTNSTYYVTPFLRTNKTGGEITGNTKSKKTP